MTLVGVAFGSPWGIRKPPICGLNYYYCPSQAASCANNGNVIGQNIAEPGAAFSQTFSYDGINRLAAATEGSTTWTQAYAYDQWGNRGVTGYRPNNDLTPKATSEYNGNNRWYRGAGDAYDGGGNQTGVGSYSAPSVSASTFGYDAENRLTSENSNGMGTVQYVYDGTGQRIEKLINGGGRVYVYDALGALAAEYTTQAIASGTMGGTSYFTVDALGSTRLVTGALGSFTAVKKRYDYLPFGEEIASGVGARTAALGYGSATYPATPDVVSEKFTGKERDVETGLDWFGARYFASTMGRFLSPDWSAKAEPVPYANLDNPQSLNLYTYVHNNPLSRNDPDGHEVDLTGTDKDKRAEQQRLAANASKTDKNGVKESSLFKPTTDKSGKTTLTLNKKAAAAYDGKHSAGYNLLTGAINAAPTITVQMSNMDSYTGRPDAQGNVTVNLNRNESEIDIFSPLRGSTGRKSPIRSVSSQAMKC